MAIQDGDEIIVERGGNFYRELASAIKDFVYKSRNPNTVEVLQIAGKNDIITANIQSINGEVHIPIFDTAIVIKEAGSYLEVNFMPQGEIDGTMGWGSGFVLKMYNGATLIAQLAQISPNYKNNDFMSGGLLCPKQHNLAVGDTVTVKVYLKNSAVGGNVQCGQVGRAWIAVRELSGTNITIV